MKPTMPLNKIHGMTMEQASDIYKKAQQFSKKRLSPEDEAKLRLLLENNTTSVSTLRSSAKASTGYKPIKMLVNGISNLYNRLIKQ